MLVARQDSPGDHIQMTRTVQEEILPLALAIELQSVCFVVEEQPLKINRGCVWDK